ncbi:DNA-entry nuclease [Salibacterium salarium]|uniref:DNA-entry nuclease n=1 Tax=Salibacterium salarium TaxID=284579 RepID=A0A3R9RD12_9BACI|nr:DNA-entry nuclease [Salibacterium salarium]RSL32639.1 DNA-entry nuclease [Salibacterium salarium]
MATESLRFDRYNRMSYHPDYHHNFQKPYCVEDLEYLCKFWEHDDWRSMAFALGRPEASLSNKVNELRKNGMYEVYKNLNHFY